MAYSYVQWPSNLPQSPLRSGYRETMPDEVLVTSFEFGPSRQRKRTSSGMEEREVSYALSYAQMNTLRNFVKENMGRSFWWPDPTAPDRGLRYARLKGGSKVSFEPIDNSDFWKASVTIQVWPYVRFE